MTYEIKQKVETPLGIGTIVGSKPILYARDVYNVELKTKERDFYIWFTQDVLKPYKTPHERLLEMGYVYEEHKQGHRYTHKENLDYIDIDLFRNTFYHFEFSFRKFPKPAGTNLELLKILTQYLEEMNEKWLKMR